jgi:hypothetical protein
MYDWRKPFPRVAAIQNRLGALVAILYANPSQEIACGYFQAQLESHHWNLLTYVSDIIVCFRVSGSSSTFWTRFALQFSIGRFSTSSICSMEFGICGST